MLQLLISVSTILVMVIVVAVLMVLMLMQLMLMLMVRFIQRGHEFGGRMRRAQPRRADGSMRRCGRR